MKDLETHAVDPARLADGQWCHRAQKTIGQGDICASYSAERIGMGQPVRKPFLWDGASYVCVCMRSCRGEMLRAEAYRLVHPQQFDGKPLTYGEKTADPDAARADPNGFYHGMLVKRAGGEWVLSGPPHAFVPGLPDQLALF